MVLATLFLLNTVALLNPILQKIRGQSLNCELLLTQAINIDNCVS